MSRRTRREYLEGEDTEHWAQSPSTFRQILRSWAVQYGPMYF